MRCRQACPHQGSKDKGQDSQATDHGGQRSQAPPWHRTRRRRSYAGVKEARLRRCRNLRLDGAQAAVEASQQIGLVVVRHGSSSGWERRLPRARLTSERTPEGVMPMTVAMSSSVSSRW